VKPSESPPDAAKRLCQTWLDALYEDIGLDLSPMEAKEEESISESTGLPTRYFRTVYKATMSPDCQWSNFAVFVPGKGSNRAHVRCSRQENVGQRYRAGSANTPTKSPSIFTFLHNLGESKLLLFAWLPAWEYHHLRYTLKGQGLAQQWLDEANYSIFSADSSRLVKVTPRDGATPRGWAVVK